MDSSQHTNAPSEGDDPNAGPHSPAEALHRIAQRQSAAKERQQISERMRQAAREMAQHMTPEERERWAQQWQKQNGQHAPVDQPPPDAMAHNNSNPGGGGPKAGHEFAEPRAGNPSPAPPQAKPDDVDLRGNEVADQPITDFLDNNPPGEPGANPGARSAATAERIRAAQQVAERAVNDSAVPSRYHQFIKRVFGNLNRAANPAAPPASQPSP